MKTRRQAGVSDYGNVGRNHSGRDCVVRLHNYRNNVLLCWQCNPRSNPRNSSQMEHTSIIASVDVGNKLHLFDFLLDATHLLDSRGCRFCVYIGSKAGVTIRLLGVIIIMLLVCGIASAIPTGGAASAISSNNFTVPVGGASGETWIAFGEAPGCEDWQSAIVTASGAVSITVYGTPLIGGTTVYYYACDSTGCDPNEQSVTLPAVTPIPTTTYGAYYRNLSSSRFSITSIPPLIMKGYQASGATEVILYGIMMFCFFAGMWFRTRSVRLPLILGFITAAFIVNPLSGLHLGAPLIFQQVASGLLAACLAGILLAFMRK